MCNMYIRFVTFRFPSQNKAEAFISMMSTPLWQEKFEKETKSMEQILIHQIGKLWTLEIFIDFDSLISVYEPII